MKFSCVWCMASTFNNVFIFCGNVQAIIIKKPQMCNNWKGGLKENQIHDGR